MLKNTNTEGRFEGVAIGKGRTARIGNLTRIAWSD